MRFLVATTVLVLVLPITGCAGQEPTSVAPVDAPELLVLTIQLAGAETDTEILRWGILSDRAVVIYSLRTCEEPGCDSSVASLHAVDERGEPWRIAELDEGASFEIGGDGTEVRVVSADGSSTPVAVESPAPIIAVSGGGSQIPEAVEIAGFSPHNEVAAVLGDGRYLIRGRWDQDEPMDSWVERTGTERTTEPRRPIRLFLYDPADEVLTPVSGIPMSSEVSTAISTSYGPDTVLRVELLPGERSVAYSVGFNGAAYDIEHSFYLAPLPSR